MRAAVHTELEHRALRLVLTSDTFTRSPNLVSVLQYLGTKYFDDKSQEIKEYSIAVEALGKPADFDPVVTSVVRVELHRLREKLKRYYETEGASDPVIIVLKPGSYIPHFVSRTEPNRVGDSHNSGPILDSEVGSGLESGERPVLSDISTRGANAHDQSGVPQKRVLRRLSVRVIAASAIALLGIGAILMLRQARSAHASLTTFQPRETLMAAAVAGEGPVRVIAGYFNDKYIASCGNVFDGDRFFSGGRAGGPQRRFIARTRDPTVFAYGRVGNFSYDIPLRPGAYELWLYFVETAVGPGSVADEGGEGTRQFDVELNGKLLLSRFDPYADAGGNFIADARVFKDVGPASDGSLHLKFKTVAGEPFVNAVAISPSTLGKLNPIRMVAQNNPVTDRSGQVWEPDRYFRGGRPVVRRNQVEGTAETNLYAGERWGSFDYAIPVAEGKYGITLYFAETYFGSLDQGGAGSRVFDVDCNGRKLLKDFDIFKEAGGPNRALQKTFHGLTPNAQGKLMLTFVPIKNYACLNAIEVVDESK